MTTPTGDDECPLAQLRRNGVIGARVERRAPLPGHDAPRAMPGWVAAAKPISSR